MTACPEYETLMIQDVFDELDAAERIRWETHLSDCSRCQTEQDRLKTLKTSITTSDTPTLSFWEAENMVGRIIATVTGKGAGKSNIFNRLPKLGRLVPVAAVACLVFFAVGILLPGDDSIRHHSAALSVEMIEMEEMEIIQNLDMLREFEAVQMLVNVVDYSEPTSPSSTGDFQTRGRTRHGTTVLFS
ncbi:MAG: zf-HC2 domain-containing protein [Deltaproteobacteria bacterium]|nr:zf-HC2 domain-containing protein [Deltaproteobacteria bacterium]